MGEWHKLLSPIAAHQFPEHNIAVHHIDIAFCATEGCHLLLDVLLWSGFFSSTLERGEYAFSLEILESFVTWTAQSHSTVALLHDSIVNGLKQQGHTFNSNEPWKHQLPEAITWYNALKFEVNTHVDRKLPICGRQPQVNLVMASMEQGSLAQENHEMTINDNNQEAMLAS
jgi:hypothetical protein